MELDRSQESKNQINGNQVAGTAVKKLLQAAPSALADSLTPQSQSALSGNTAPALEIKHLMTRFHTTKGIVNAVNDVSLSVPRGKIVGVVGESGCGKSMTAMSVMQLVRKPGRIESGEILLDGKDLLHCSAKEMRGIRGSRISMIFQEPMTSLNPLYTVGWQVSEEIRLHEKLSRREAKEKAIGIFRDVGIPEPEKRYDAYPHQLSGGMRQRVMIGMAMVCKPEVLIADEPTTALDVTIEAQILNLMKRLRDENGTSILLITHNMGVVAEVCDLVYVMYAGRVVEYAETFELFRNTQHPYTRGLLQSIPRLDRVEERLYNIRGHVPDLRALPKGCSFADRCDFASARCSEECPPLVEVCPGHGVRCVLAEEHIDVQAAGKEAGKAKAVPEDAKGHTAEAAQFGTANRAAEDAACERTAQTVSGAESKAEMNADAGTAADGKSGKEEKEVHA